ncbi:MAG TPA: nuclear transport factor 2 family protein [Candidatus Acidoferrales bacterium]|nr:nuclear transport factor 2 family protein [Candidatus Acidoferrales bacterium]
MRRVWLAFTVAICVTMPAIATEKTDVMARVRRFVTDFNKGDTKAAMAACSDVTSIIDEFPPHQWQGADACSKWMNDYNAWAAQGGVSGGRVILGVPLHVDITGDRAYVVVPASFTYKQKGKPVREMGSRLTVVLAKGGAGWRMVAWAWTER